MTNKINNKNKEIMEIIENLGYEISDVKNENTFVISKNDVNLEINLSKEQLKDDLKFYNLENNKENRKRIIINEICYNLENVIDWKAEIFGVGVNEDEMKEQDKEIRRYQENLNELKNQTIELI